MSPLASLKVLDFTTLLPGPFATMMLADLGADVVRIEAPHRPDLMRLTPPYEDDVSAGHALVGRSKRSVALDLKHPEAAGVVRRLMQDYDIVIEGFRPGVMDRLGVGYDALSAINPRLIYVSLTGYGHTGPYRDRAGHDLNYLALAGVLSFSGTQESGPHVPGLPMADLAGSLHAVIGLLAAVVHRHETGEGQHLDLAMLDATLALAAFPFRRYLAAGDVPTFEDDPLTGGSFYGVYRTADERHLAVGSLEPPFFAGFCEAIGRPDLFEPGMQFWDPAAQARVKAAIAEAIAAKTLAEWQKVFAGRDVCVEPVLRLDEVAEHPHVAARAMIAEVPGPDAQARRQIGSPFRFSKTPPHYACTGGPLGADTHAVLAEAGFTPDAIRHLEASGAFG